MGQEFGLGALVAFGVVALSLSSACGGNVRSDQALARMSASVARVDVLEGRDCGAWANVVSMPDHCAISARAARSWMLSADVQFVADVALDGRPNTVKVLKAPAGFDLEDSVVDCAMRGEYSAPFDTNGARVAGETCPVTLRLRRYASDSGQADPPPIPCPVVQPYSVNASIYGGGVMGVPSGTNCVSR